MERVESVLHISRLIEFEADFYILRNDRLEAGDVGFHFIYDLERGGVRALGNGNKDRSTAVEERVSSQDVRAVFNKTDVPQKNCRARPSADRELVQAMNVCNQIGRAHV